jgi:hypothetical protein
VEELEAHSHMREQEQLGVTEGLNQVEVTVGAQVERA